MKLTTTGVFLLAVFCLIPAARPDNFGSGANSFSIEFVEIGSPGNPNDGTGNPISVGSVDYRYRMGKHEISEDMINKANALGNMGIEHSNRGPNKPATNISWNEAALFVNWLNTSEGYSPAYLFDVFGFLPWRPDDPGFDFDNRYRNSLARYFLPSVDEWYKAAYYDPVSGSYFDYATGSDTLPTAVAGGTAPGTAVYNQTDPVTQSPADITNAGGLSPFGTMAQNGNVWEWEETALDLVNDDDEEARGERGASYVSQGLFMSSIIRFAGDPADNSAFRGFRIASVVIPEPNALVMVSVLLLGTIPSRRR